MPIQQTGNDRIDQATAEIATALRDASPGKPDQRYYDEAMRLRDEIMAGATEGSRRGKDPESANVAGLGPGGIRYHSSDDMDGLHELAGVTEPVAVVIRPGGSIDAYGLVGIVDQREPSPDSECPDCGQPYPQNKDCLTCTERHLGDSGAAETFITANLAAACVPAGRLPGRCPSCGKRVASWPLGTYGNRVGLSCPHCHVTAARVELIAREGLT